MTVVVASPGGGVVPTGDEGAGDEASEVTPGAEEVSAGVEAAEVPLGGVDTAEELTGKTPVELGPAGTLELTVAAVVSVTGHTVVAIGIVEVTTVVESAGQLTTSGAQLVMVTSLVVYTVEVVIWTGVVTSGVEAAEVPAGLLVVKGTDVPLGGGTPSDELIGRTLLGLGTTGIDTELVTAAVVSAVVSVTGQTVVEIAIVEVTTVVESAGQLTTSGAQLVIVTSLVVYTVEVVIRTGVVISGVEAAEDPAGVWLVVKGTDDEAEIEDVETDVPLGGTPADELTGRTLLGLGTSGTDSEVVAAAVVSAVVSVTGQTVVERAIVEVTTVVEPDPAGQSVTVGPQLVMVNKLVVNTVDVVIRRGVLTAVVVPGATVEPGTEAEGTTMGLEAADTDICSYGTLVTGVAVRTGAGMVEPGVQSKPTL
jgi:uncharacterized Zn ribbon protein